MERRQEIFQELLELLIYTVSIITKLFASWVLVRGITKPAIQNVVAHYFP